MKHTALSLRLILFCSVLASSIPLWSQNLHTITRKIAVSGNDTWDYLSIDAERNYAYVSHGSCVQVVDLASGRQIDSIGDLHGVHGIALAPDLSKGFISNGKSNTITVFDLESHKVQDSILLKSDDPDAIVYDSLSKLVFVMNGRSASLTVLDATTNKVKSVVQLEGKPEAAICDGRGYVYVNIQDKGDVCVLNTRTLRVEKTFSVAPGEGPNAIALDVFGGRIFSACANRLLIVLDIHNGKLVAKVPITTRVDGIVYDPTQAQIFCSGGDGIMSIITQVDANTYKVAETMATSRGAKTCALNPKTHSVYMPSADMLFFAPTEQDPHPKPLMKPNTFTLLEVKQKQ